MDTLIEIMEEALLAIATPIPVPTRTLRGSRFSMSFVERKRAPALPGAAPPPRGKSAGRGGSSADGGGGGGSPTASAGTNPTSPPAPTAAGDVRLKAAEWASSRSLSRVRL